MKDDELWHYDFNRRRRYQFCGDCDYKNAFRCALVAHVNTTHPSSKTALPPPMKKVRVPKSIQLHCSHRCDYQTTSKIQMEEHENYHTKKSTYECIFCTYSVKTAQFLQFHLKRDHPESLVGGVPSIGELYFIATKEKVHHSGPTIKNNHQENSSNDTSFDIIPVGFFKNLYILYFLYIFIILLRELIYLFFNVH